MNAIYGYGLALLLVTPGCGKRNLPSNADASADATSDLGAVLDTAPSTDAASGQCVVAIRLGVCCPQPTPISAQEVAADPCLVPYAARWVDRPECTPPTPEYCDAVECDEPPPFSRVADRATDGQCVFVDECASVADCVMASNVRRCCACGRAYPAALATSDACLLAGRHDDAQCVERCDPVKDGIQCEMCLDLPVLACITTDQAHGKAFQICDAAPPCSCNGGCEPWQQCLISQGGGMGPNGPECGEAFGLAQCRPDCGDTASACPAHRPHCKRLKFTDGCCTDALISHQVCCANDDATDLSNCY